MLNDGQWLDDGLSAPGSLGNWQPDGCMLRQYNAAAVNTCLKGRTLYFTGDSIVRRIFFATIKLLDPSYDLDDSKRDDKHRDASMTIKDVQLQYAWDPFLNSNRTIDLLERRDILQKDGDRPAIMIMGTGIHELSYFGTQEGREMYIEAIERIAKATGPSLKERPQVADEVVLLPVEHTIPAKLSDYRRPKMQNADIDMLNAELSRIIPPYTSPTVSDLSVLYAMNKLVEFPTAINHTEDGLHFDNLIASTQVNLIFNLRCNDVMPKKFPFSTTCCMQYPAPNWLQFAIILMLVVWAPLGMHYYASGEFAVRLLNSFGVIAGIAV